MGWNCYKELETGYSYERVGYLKLRLWKSCTASNVRTSVAICWNWIAEVGLETRSLKESEVSQLCPTLCDPLDCSPPGSSIHGIFQARELEWVAIAFSRGSSQPRDWTQVSLIVGRPFTIWATREVSKITEVEIKLRMYWKIPYLSDEISKKN